MVNNTVASADPPHEIKITAIQWRARRFFRSARNFHSTGMAIRLTMICSTSTICVDVIVFSKIMRKRGRHPIRRRRELQARIRYYFVPCGKQVMLLMSFPYSGLLRQNTESSVGKIDKSPRFGIYQINGGLIKTCVRKEAFRERHVNVLIFSHPDCTVGLGFTPSQSLDVLR